MGSSSNRQKTLIDSYILGLWGADGYHRTSSIGLTSVSPELIKRFYLFLITNFSLLRIRLRVYSNNGGVVVLPSEMKWYKGKLLFSKGTKLSNLAYQIYVNSRPLLREFNDLISNRVTRQPDKIVKYFAGRFDGDGSVAKDFRTDFRVVYKDNRQASIDKQLLKKIGFDSQIYRYQKAGTHVIYVSRYLSEKLCRILKPYSAKLTGLLVTP